jgi:hypothetical protein
VFASTIVSYAGDLARLAERVRAVAERGAPPDRAAHVVDAVIEAARATLALRDALRDRVFARVADLARASLPEVDLRARDRKLDDAARKRWSAARRDLEILAAEPAKILAAPFAERLAAWPELIDEPNEPEVTFADMIELD